MTSGAGEPVMEVSFVIIGEGRAVERTRSSLTSDTSFASAEVIVAAQSDTAPWATCRGDVVVMLRAGDIVVPDGMASLIAAVGASGSIVGGHRLRGSDRWGEVVMPPWAGALVDESLAVDCSIELSALAVRRDALPERVDPPPADPGGDVALFVGQATGSGLRSLHEVVVEVRQRPIHSADQRPRLDRLLGLLGGSTDLTVATRTRIRRRALASVFLLDAAGPAQVVSPEQWWGDTLGDDRTEVLGIVSDLHWTLARASEALHLVQAGLDPIIESAPADSYVSPLFDIDELRTNLQTVHRLVAEREATVMRLVEEVAARDRYAADLLSMVRERDDLLRQAAEISSRELGSSETAGSVSCGPLVASTSGQDLLRVAVRRAGRRLYRTAPEPVRTVARAARRRRDR